MKTILHILARLFVRCITGGILLFPGMLPAVPSLPRPGTTLHCIAVAVAVRARPSINARRLGDLHLGEAVVLLAVGKNEETLRITAVRHLPETHATAHWYRVRTAAGLKGWAFGAFLHARWYPIAPRKDLPKTGLYLLGWSRDGKAACLVAGSEGLGLYIYDVGTDRLLERTGFYDRMSWDTKPFAKWIDWLWAVFKIRIHTTLNTWGIESAGRIRPFTASVVRHGIAFEYRRTTNTFWKIAPGGRRRVIPGQDSGMPSDFYAIIENPFGREVLFVGTSGISTPGFYGDVFAWTARDRTLQGRDQDSTR